MKRTERSQWQKKCHCHQHVPSASKMNCSRMIFIGLFVEESLLRNSASYLINKTSVSKPRSDEALTSSVH